MAVISSSIEWTDATWSPVRGCSVLSAGCQHCYAMKQAHRFSGPGMPYDGLTKTTSHGPVWTGEVRPVPALLDEPLRWRRPRRIFVNSMSDLFHEDVPWGFIERVFETMVACPHHTFQILTKRAERLHEMASRLPWPSNVWIGVSVEDRRVLHRIAHLRAVRAAAVRFLSCEPLIGPLERLPLSGIHWVIVGGESGPRARTMKQAWVESIHRQCVAAGVPFFFKQWGGTRKSLTGRMLHGRTFDEMPAAARLALAAA
jgi:protein gp37